MTDRVQSVWLVNRRGRIGAQVITHILCLIYDSEGLWGTLRCVQGLLPCLVSWNQVALTSLPQSQGLRFSQGRHGLLVPFLRANVYGPTPLLSQQDSVSPVHYIILGPVHGLWKKHRSQK